MNTSFMLKASLYPAQLFKRIVESISDVSRITLFSYSPEKILIQGRDSSSVAVVHVTLTSAAFSLFDSDSEGGTFALDSVFLKHACKGINDDDTLTLSMSAGDKVSLVGSNSSLTRIAQFDASMLSLSEEEGNLVDIPLEIDFSGVASLPSLLLKEQVAPFLSLSDEVRLTIEKHALVVDAMALDTSGRNKISSSRISLSSAVTTLDSVESVSANVSTRFLPKMFLIMLIAPHVTLSIRDAFPVELRADLGGAIVVQAFIAPRIE